MFNKRKSVELLNMPICTIEYFQSKTAKAKIHELCRRKLFQTVDIFDNVLFYRRECLVAYVVLELACVLDRDFFADAEADQQIREHGVPLVYLMRDLKPRIGEC